MMDTPNTPIWMCSSPSWSQEEELGHNETTQHGEQQQSTNGFMVPLSPPLDGPDGEGSSSGDETPISRFRRDASANADESANAPNVPSPCNRPFSCFLSQEILASRELAIPSQIELGKIGDTNNISSFNGTGLLRSQGEEVEDAASLLYVEQAREAIGAVTDSETTRLSDDRIQQILVAAMMYEKDHAPTVPSRQPLVSDSTETNQNLLAPPIPTNPLHLAAEAAVLPLPPFPNMDTAGCRGGDSSASISSNAQCSEQDSAPSDQPDQPQSSSGNVKEVISLIKEDPVSPDGLGIVVPNHNTAEGRSGARDDQLGCDDIVQRQAAEWNQEFDHQGGIEEEHVSDAGVPQPDRLDQETRGSTSAVVENTDNLGVSSKQSQQGDTRSSDDEDDDEFTVGIPKLIELSSSQPSIRNNHSYRASSSDSELEEEKKEGKIANPGQSETHQNQKREDSLDPAFLSRDAEHELRMMRSYSVTESDVGSIDGLPSRLQSTLLNDDRGRDRLLQKLDGVAVSGETSPHWIPNPLPNGDKKSDSASPIQSHLSCFESMGLSFLWKGFVGDDPVVEEGVKTGPDETQHRKKSLEPKAKVPAKDGDYWDERAGQAFDLLGHCSAIVSHRLTEHVPVATSLVRVTGETMPPSYAETIRANEIDPRLQSWIHSHCAMHEAPPSDGSYDLGRSRTVVVHEIARGDWTWCTAWSPSGDRLAVATENHHMAVIETTSSIVWRVRHDRRLKGPAAGDTTHSIRSLAWGKNFIAAGGTGNAVSILSPIEPYDVLHLIKGTGFVGSLDWKDKSNLLVIGSRSKKFLIVRVRSTDGGKNVQSEQVYCAEFDNWVNRVAFSPDGSYLAAGNASGVLSVYNVSEETEGNNPSNGGASSSLEVSPINEFQLDDAVLALDWSPDGRWLYAGGEDYHIAVIETTYWEMVHKIPRERWVQCIASSGSGTHMAVGGVSSEISLLDVRNGWNSVMGIELKGLVPLSASWHPKDQALALTGQNNSVLVVETTNARHVQGHHLHSIFPVIAVCFSPDGRTAVIGNTTGVVTFFSLSGSTFESTYEIVVILHDRLSIDWSLNGLFAVIGSKDALIIVGLNTRAPSYQRWRKHVASTNGPARRAPPNASVFSIQRVIRNIGETNCVSIDSRSRFVAVAGDRTRIFDATEDFAMVKSWKTGVTYATAWSPGGHWLASIGFGKVLSIFDTSNTRVSRWREVFSLKCDFNGYALAWAPHFVGGLVYLAYGGGSKIIHIMEIRTLEGTWETVLRIPRDGQIRDLDWGTNGLLAAGIDNGTVSIIDLAYLLSGVAVNEKDYNWQRQALTCYTEIRRNRGHNSIQAVRWIPSAPGSDSLIAVGGTDGEMEIVDLTERRRCRGYSTLKSAASSHKQKHKPYQ